MFEGQGREWQLHPGTIYSTEIAGELYRIFPGADGWYVDQYDSRVSGYVELLPGKFADPMTAALAFEGADRDRVELFEES